jgi:DNA-directed RNA polymerase subunit RPC12/RpoP
MENNESRVDPDERTGIRDADLIDEGRPLPLMAEPLDPIYHPQPQAIKPADVKLVHYRCCQCGAEDVGKYFIGVEHDHVAPAINCWKCGAGRKHTTQQQVEQLIGMLVYVPDEDESGQQEGRPS